MIIVWRRYYKTRTKKVRKSVQCASCGCQYSYTFKAIGKGRGVSLYWLNNRGAAQRAETSASNNLARAVERGGAVACPDCLRLPPAIVWHLRWKLLKYMILAGLLALFSMAFFAGAEKQEALVGLIPAVGSSAFFLVGAIKYLSATSPSARRRSLQECSVIRNGVREPAEVEMNAIDEGPLEMETYEPTEPVDKSLAVSALKMPVIREGLEPPPLNEESAEATVSAPPVEEEDDGPWVRPERRNQATAPQDIIMRCACGQVFSADPSLAGRRARCRGCGHVFTIGAA
ncbi:MAG TPA: hypothetical protein VMD30_08500 [Tepidisphaeraceae bacterium]|nr:hypothetical protein [Tepidisphaeraceae bacterium]